MKQNKYDDVNFFSEFKKMERSVNGLEGAGEWHVFKELLPQLQNKSVLDLGCGFGWHCRYAREQHARSVIGVDISEKMLQQAHEMTNDSFITYMKMPIEGINFSDSQFDVVISSLAFHYIQSFDAVCKKIYDCLKPGGSFVFQWNIQFSLLETNKIGIMMPKDIVYIGPLTITNWKDCVKPHS